MPEAVSHLDLAIALSEEALSKAAGGPFGAVIVKNGEVIATGTNQVTSTNDPTAHAEMVAIRKAAAVLNDFSLKGCTIYSSCEPCPMCLSAIYWARIDKVIFSNSRHDAAAIGFDDAFLYEELTKPIAEREIPTIQMKSLQALSVFQSWAGKEDKIEY